VEHRNDALNLLRQACNRVTQLVDLLEDVAAIA
jgi:hypothetical protein